MSTRVAKPKTGRPRGAGSFDSEVATVVGDVIRKNRLAAGISQETLADMANVGRSYCGSVERGESQPTLFVVLKMAAALEIEGHTLVRQVEHALARRRFKGATKPKRS
ncbi:helix-turn-helix domain-containing protein [Rhizobacter sp. J219]|jgi:ribosome-binding protein aMBF1 (putative translation factor)|uniref:Helix-turn-helix transcriptional regulator n=1 Tax=Piscinibacter gummiphilus TaxID=946333 RepID=A0ABZ0D0S9_9BURK|nr:MULTISPECIES: helix-turn-helix transcriptional regulator [Burkholderiales]MCR5882278.1 helix-turn-helix domain-containing protein [Rhizobacter sp. J219]WOB10852.1 helix-turn-helix transcriptional regulator [Piscinibacter gummiphilus]